MMPDCSVYICFGGEILKQVHIVDSGFIRWEPSEYANDILGVPFLSFTPQTSFDNSASVLYISLLNNLLWFS